jgi:hypothetical protein
MPPITKEQARDLARGFYELSHTLGQYRFANWDALGADQRKSLQDLEWSLENMSSDMTTHAVDIVLDDIDNQVQAIGAATDKAKTVVADIHTVGNVLTLATKALALGGALISHDPSAIANATGGLVAAIKAA